AVGFEIERVEQGAPPFRRQVPFEIRYRPQSAQPRAVVLPARIAFGPRDGGHEVEPRGGAVAVLLCHLYYPRGHKKWRRPERDDRRRGEPPGSEGGHGRSRPEERGGSARRRRCEAGNARTTATIELSGPARCLSAYDYVPSSPTAQTGEKFGATLAAFKSVRIAPREAMAGASSRRPGEDRARRIGPAYGAVRS